MKEVMRIIKILVACSAISAVNAFAAEQPRCQQQTVENIKMEMCLLPGAAFQHDMYTLKADKTLVFALVDDYSEKVEMEHVIPEGQTIELPLSKQNMSPIKITGGCIPESKEGAEIARVCNFYWGKLQVVKNARFEFN